MLLGGKQADIKQVAVVSRNLRFKRLLSRILAEWKFFAVDDLASAKVIFAERGVELPQVDAQIVWLTPMPLSEGSFLTTPISLTRLYHLLEVHFFPTPRRHIRISMEASVSIKQDSVWQDGQLISLSDRGARLTCQGEIERGMLLQIELRLTGKYLQCPAEVLYCIPAGDAPGRLQPQIGVLFKPANEQVIVGIRRFIEKMTVEKVCASEEISLHDSCLSWLDVPADPWSEVI